jgi:signal transduction histidine kinase
MMQMEMMDIKPEKVNLLKQIIDCVGLIVELARKKNITVSFDIPEDIEIFTDTHMFETIIRNLVSNSVKFTPNGGRISISAAVISTEIEIKVTDTGIGMSPALIDELFIINEHVNRIGTDGEPSTGLGLLLCKEFVEKLGGKICAQSEAGIGSIFSLHLPMKRVS